MKILFITKIVLLSVKSVRQRVFISVSKQKRNKMMPFICYEEKEKKKTQNFNISRHKNNLNHDKFGPRKFILTFVYYSKYNFYIFGCPCNKKLRSLYTLPRIFFHLFGSSQDFFFFCEEKKKGVLAH